MWRATVAASRPSSARRSRSGAPCWYCRRSSRPASASCSLTSARSCRWRLAIASSSASRVRRCCDRSKSARCASLTARPLARSAPAASPRDSSAAASSSCSFSMRPRRSRSSDSLTGAANATAPRAASRTKRTRPRSRPPPAASMPLPRFSLSGARLHRFGHRVRIAKVVAAHPTQRLVVELVDERDPGRHVFAHDGLVRHGVEILDQCAQAVAVRRDEDAIAGGHPWSNALLPAGDDPRHRVLQAFGERQLLGTQRRVTPVARGIAFVGRVQRGRPHVVAASPDEHLLLAVAGRRFGLVESGEGAVMAFIEMPVLVDREPQPIHLLEREMQRADGALEHRGEGDVEVVARRGEHPPRGAGLFDAARRQVHVLPAGEAVLLVPLALAVAKQHDLLHARSLANAARPPQVWLLEWAIG